MAVKLRTKTLKRGKKSYYLDIYLPNGERSYEFLKIYTSPEDKPEDRRVKQKQARSIASIREIEVNEGVYNLKTAQNKKVDFLHYYQTYADSYTKKDIRKIVASLRKFKQYYTKDKLPLSQLTKKLCEGYCEWLYSENSGLTGETPHNYFKMLNKVILQAIEDGILTDNPTKGIKVKQQQNDLRKNILTKEELQTLHNTYCGNETIKRAFLFACFTGMGRAEIDCLTWEHIKDGKLHYIRKKTDKNVIVPLSKTALAMLGERGEATDIIFNLPTSNGINKTLKYWIKRASIDKKITFYCGRHTFATQLLLNGANLLTVSKLMGQTSTTHTIKYLNYIDSLKSDAIANLPELDI